jgi:hypothetical protein
LATNSKAAAAAPARKKTTSTTRKRKTRVASNRLVTHHIEYFTLDSALVRGGGTVTRDRLAGATVRRARTDRLRDARVYRTGADRLTIQQADGDELVLSISRLIRICERARDLAVTSEIPSFDHRR